jgi:membrane-associated phospholipid phosphatase
MSLYLLFVIAPCVLRTRHGILTLARAQILASLLGGAGFLLCPAQLAFPVPTDTELGIWRVLFRWADYLNLEYNLLPSMHVALSMTCIRLFVPHANITQARVLRCWGALIALSTLLIHQHHVLDVLALCCRRGGDTMSTGSRVDPNFPLEPHG